MESIVRVLSELEEPAAETPEISTYLLLNKTDRIWQGLQESRLAHLLYRLLVGGVGAAALQCGRLAARQMSGLPLLPEFTLPLRPRWGETGRCRRHTLTLSGKRFAVTRGRTAPL